MLPAEHTQRGWLVGSGHLPYAPLTPQRLRWPRVAARPFWQPDRFGTLLDPSSD